MLPSAESEVKYSVSVGARDTFELIWARDGAVVPWPPVGALDGVGLRVRELSSTTRMVGNGVGFAEVVTSGVESTVGL
jgi:hypothetical protein